MIVARRLVARKCLYDVDLNPVAVDLAKMSLWLATLARDHPLTFINLGPPYPGGPGHVAAGEQVQMDVEHRLARRGRCS